MPEGLELSSASFRAFESGGERLEGLEFDEFFEGWSDNCLDKVECLSVIDLPDLPEIFAVEVFKALAAVLAAFAACLERLARRAARFRLAWTLFLGGRPRRRRDLMFSAEGGNEMSWRGFKKQFVTSPSKRQVNRP